MLTVKDVKDIINQNLINIIYEDHWNGWKYNYVDENSQVNLIIPVDSSTIKLSVTV